MARASLRSITGPWCCGAAASWIVLVTGCGRGGDRAGVHGMVTLAGSPLPYGVIEFYQPALDGPAGGAAIVDGKYVVPRTHGLLPGEYRVVIRSEVEASAGASIQSTPDAAPPAKVAAAASGPRFRDRIPAEFGDKSTLTASLQAGQDLALDVVIP